MSIKFIFVSDGSSDRTLVYVLRWICRERFQRTIEGDWFDPRPYGPPTLSLRESIIRSLKLFECDILFVHRDAESEDPETRFNEINEAASCLAGKDHCPPLICVVPVRMTEAWLLFDERAIRQAASNPNGAKKLDLPSIHKLERVPDPKRVLFKAIQEASGLNGRRLKKLRLGRCRLRVAELISDFSPLRSLSAFNRLETSINDLKLNGF